MYSTVLSITNVAMPRTPVRGMSHFSERDRKGGFMKTAIPEYRYSPQLNLSVG